MIITVKVRKHPQGVDRALKQMKKIMEKEGIIREIKERRYFEKPSAKRKKKSIRARTRKDK